MSSNYRMVILCFTSWSTETCREKMQRPLATRLKGDFRTLIPSMIYQVRILKKGNVVQYFIQYFQFYLAFKSSLFDTIYRDVANKYGIFVWVGYRRMPKAYGKMKNVYSKQKSAILPYQHDIGQDCAAYNPFYKSYSYFDFYCGAYDKIRPDDFYLTLCLVEDDGEQRYSSSNAQYSSLYSSWTVVALMSYSTAIISINNKMYIIFYAYVTYTCDRLHTSFTESTGELGPSFAP